MGEFDSMTYKLMLYTVRNRMSDIAQVSLESDTYNNEWRELEAMQDNLIRLIKITEERK